MVSRCTCIIMTCSLVFCLSLPNTLTAQDTDQDGIPDSTDNCPFVYNPMQEDTADDGIGDSSEYENDISIDFVGVPFPHSVGCPVTVRSLIRNSGSHDQDPVFIWGFLETIDGYILTPSFPIGPPWFSVKASETITLEFEFTPTDTGTYRLALFQFLPDENTENDTCHSSFFHVYPENEGYMAYYLTPADTHWQSEAGEGPAVLFDPPPDIFYPFIYPFNFQYIIETIEIEMTGTGDCLLHVIEASGSNDTIPDDGAELIDPIVMSIPEHEGPFNHTVDVRHLEELKKMMGPFFIWLEMQPGAHLFWTGSTSPFGSTHSYLYSNEEWHHVNHEYIMKCYLKWGIPEEDCGNRCDDNFDYVINVLDAIEEIRCIIEENCDELEPCAYWRADCTGDGVINILDVLAKINIILGIIPPPDKTPSSLIEKTE